MPSDLEAGRAGSRSRAAVLLLCILVAVVLGLVLRTWAAPSVFTPDRIFFYGTDPWYHVLRAGWIAAGDWDRAWFDPDMAFPEGARVPWPPLFDLLIASAAVLLEKLSILPSALGPVAALISPVLGAATIAALAVLAWRFSGPGVALGAALLLAVMPVHLDYTRVGRPDQHSAEALLSLLSFLFFLTAATAGSRGSRIASSCLFGLTIALSCWTWMGAMLYLFLPVLCLAALWAIGDRAPMEATRRCAAAVAAGGGLAAVLLALSLVLWGPEGALGKVDLLGLSGFHVLLALLATAFAALLAWASIVPGLRAGGARLAVLALAAVAPPAVLFLTVPGFRESLGVGLEIFGEDNPWFHTISEFQPLFFQQYQTLGQELRVALETYGLGLLLMPVSAIALFRAWRREPENRTVLVFHLIWGIFFLAATLVRKRFGYYLAVPLSLWLAFGCGQAAHLLSRRGLRKAWSWGLPVLALLVLLSPAVRGVRDVLAPKPEWRQELFSTLDWLGDEEPLSGREAALADWDFGHYVESIARKPVVVNPFGTHLGPAPMRDAATFFLADRPGPALEVLRRRRVGFLLLNDPVHYYGLAPFLPGSEASGQGHVRGEPPEMNRLLVTQLYYLDRLVARPDEPALDLGFRLLYESHTEKKWRRWTGRRYKVFGVVPGVTLVVRARPGSQVIAGIRATSNQGRRFLWTGRAAADGNGEARLVLPYACGRNGAVLAPGPYEVTDGSRTATLRITEEQVLSGAVVRLGLAGSATDDGRE